MMSQPSNLLIVLAVLLPLFASAEEKVDFNRDIRPILSNACFRCHGPDEAERKGGSKKDGGLRLDVRDAAIADLGGYAAVVPGKHAMSELIRRIENADPDEVMPPPEGGKPLAPGAVALLKRWVDEGAAYATHWAYVPPTGRTPPAVTTPGWARNAIDHFILKRLEDEGLRPMPEADRYALARRVSLDLTGLPPTPEEVEAFVNDGSGDAYEKFVDAMLGKQGFGEHWARMWLDLARYADSAGYADDPSRTIWAYRDYVIRAFNANKPFDTFTIEQLAGDLLPDPTQDQLIATAFHRNTQTNNEGGTDDEEFRNVAVVDRVNTTMATWMGTTMACAQCHTHKYDPITQKEYFEVFAIFNNSADADRRDESPFIEVVTPEFERAKADKEAAIARLKAQLARPTPLQRRAFEEWQERTRSRATTWLPVRPAAMAATSGAELKLLEDDSILVAGPDAETDSYSITAPLPAGAITAVRVEALPGPGPDGAQGPGRNGNFVLSELAVTAASAQPSPLEGRFVRIALQGSGKMIHLAEVEVFSGGANIAPKGMASQSTTYADAAASRAIDGNTNGDYSGQSVSHTAAEASDPWWEVDLGESAALERIVVWNRTDAGLAARLDGFQLTVLNAQRKPVWQETIAKAPERDLEVALDGSRRVMLQNATATYSQEKFDVGQAIDGNEAGDSGWAIGPRTGEAHTAVFETVDPVRVTGEGAALTFVLKHNHPKHALGRFRLSLSSDPQPLRVLPSEVTAALAKSADSRSEAEAALLFDAFASSDPSLQALRDETARLEKELAEMKPPTTVPVMRELPEQQQRKTHIQLRGNHLTLGDEVRPGLPGNLHPAPDAAGDTPDRLALARWLVDADNPLTARVTANRFWEAIFGIGIVRTSEEFGSQGEAPTHPELLDWLALELVRSRWNTKGFLKLLVMSAAYRQSSKVTPELMERDPENRLLARGPRFRISAEMVRDQALFAAGLLSDKAFGPPVNPPQPSIGLSAAFGGGIDWKTSDGEDKYRRGLYTSWRRSNPYPSMATFDAPNREVCTIRRDRTNTPLQALVTLNDPVYMEAAQGLARRLVALGKPERETIDAAYMICLSRQASDAEINAIVSLLNRTRQRLGQDPQRAMQLATDPLGPAPEGSDVATLAAWSVVGNVMLNLDEVFLKR